MRLNEFGKRFLPYVEEAFACLQNGVDAVHAAQGRHLQLVSFSVQDGALWDGLLLAFGAEHPDIHIRQLSRDPDRQGKLLEQANLDFIVTDLDLSSSALDHCDLFRDKLVLAVSRITPGPLRRHARSIFDFQEDLFLLRPKTISSSNLWIRSSRRSASVPPKPWPWNTCCAIACLRRAGRHRHHPVRRAPGKSLSDSAVCLEIKEFSDFSLVKKLYWKKTAPLSPSAAIFKEYLQNYPYLSKD